jgi:hypothetical protein
MLDKPFEQSVSLCWTKSLDNVPLSLHYHVLLYHLRQEIFLLPREHSQVQQYIPIFEKYIMFVSYKKCCYFDTCISWQNIKWVEYYETNLDIRSICRHKIFIYVWSSFSYPRFTTINATSTSDFSKKSLTSSAFKTQFFGAI